MTERKERTLYGRRRGKKLRAGQEALLDTLLPRLALELPPEGEKLDAISKFQERMDLLDLFQRAFFGFYDRFVTDRRDQKKWNATVKEIHAWVKDRRTRK